MIVSRKRVLLVDDEPGILKVISIKLRISGFGVITAHGGQEALNLLKTESPDIVLLDVIMPGIDGFEVLQQLRAFSKLPVIVFSARSSVAEQALSLGASDFILKPFLPEELAEKIKETIRRSS